eukprot:TCONS_00073507-protein
MSSKLLNSIFLWVDPEPFDIGILPHPVPVKLTHHNLRKLFAYAKNKGKSGYPRISYSVWKHVACNKLQIEEQLAWLYFHTCEILTERNQEHHMKNAESFNTKNTQQLESSKEKRSVDLLKFILYLFIQRANVISLKSALVTGDEYPSKQKSQDLDGRAGIGLKSLNEHAQMSFMASNMADILDLLVEPDTLSSDVNDMQLTRDAVSKLGFLIGATCDGRTVIPLDSAASTQNEFQKAGYSKIMQMFSCRRLQSWLKAHLKRNPFGTYSCLSLGQKLRGRGYSCGDDSFNTSLNLSFNDESSTSSSFTHTPTSTRNSSQNSSSQQYDWSHIQEQISRDIDLTASFKSSQPNMVNRILSNSNYAPECSKRIICNQVCHRTVARTGDILSQSMAKVHRCQHSHLFLLSSLRSVVIEKCHDTTIVLGSVDTLVVVIACEKIRIFAPCKRILIISCRKSSFNLCTPSRPVLLGKNEDITFTPYYTSYPGLINDMNVCGIPPEPNLWNNPLCFGLSPGDEKEKKIWKECPPEQFFKFVIPFEIDGKCKECPVHLPEKYQDALRQRESRVEDWHTMVRDSGMKHDQRKRLQSLVNERFQEWLKESGNSSFLESLAPPVPPTPPR